MGAASMRSTCAASAAGSLSVPAAAAAVSASSGGAFQRKYDRREASAYWLRMPAGVEVSGADSVHTAATGSGSTSPRNRNFGDSSAACSAHDRPASALLAQVFVYAAYASSSLASTGRRKALGSQVVRIVRTQAAPVAGLFVRSHVTSWARAAGAASAVVTAFFAASR